MKMEFSRQSFEKYSNIKFYENGGNFMKIRLVRAEWSHAGGQTDRYDEANSRFSQFCEQASLS
jgi:hypothetical protein